MALKRVIFALYFNQGTYCLSRNFQLQNVGDINWLIDKFRFDVIGQYVDELVIYNVDRESKDFDSSILLDLKAMQEKIFLPISVGGNLRNINDVDKCFKAGFDKVIFSGHVFEDIQLVYDVIEKYGSQAVVIQLDYRIEDSKYMCYTNHGKIPRGNLSDIVSRIAGINYGEIILNSIDLDGTGFGFDLTLLNSIEVEHHPLIMSGGGGNFSHFKRLLDMDSVTAGVTGDLFNFIGDGFKIVKEGLLASNIPVRRIQL